MNKRNYHLYQVCFIFGVALILITFFGSEELSAWANDRTNPVSRKIFAPLVALHEFNSESGFASPVSTLNKDFKSVRDFTFEKRTEIEIEPIIENVIELETILIPDTTIVEAKKKLRVKGKISMLLAGDSLVKAANYRFTTIANQYDDFIFRVEGIVSANLINLGHFDWVKRSAVIAAEEDWDIVIIMLGANAAQPIFQDNKHIYFDTPEWIEIYKSRATEMINNYKNDGAKVWWVGLPPMRKKYYKDNMVILNSIIKEVCEETDIEYISIDEIFGDENGKYIHYKMIDGKQVAIRTDGIHYSVPGAELLSVFLIDKVRKEFKFKSAEMIEATKIEKEKEQIRFELIYNRED